MVVVPRIQVILLLVIVALSSTAAHLSKACKPASELQEVKRLIILLIAKGLIGLALAYLKELQEQLMQKFMYSVITPYDISTS